MAPVRPSPALVVRARNARAANLRSRVDAVAGDVPGALASAGVEAIVLKGPSITNWLYQGDSDRIYIDLDLLVAPADLDQAGQALSELGFTLVFDDRETNIPHAQAWERSDGAPVDLHWRLPGVECAPEDAWKRLSRGATMTIAGTEVKILDSTARAMHVATHAAQHPTESSAVPDLERALATLEPRIWVAARDLAGELDALTAFAVGLRRTAAGEAVAEGLGLSYAGARRWSLRIGDAPPGSYRLHEVLDAPSAGRQLRLLARALFPAASYMRGIAPEARGNQRALALAYIRRLAKGARHARAAARAARQT
jgi:hypothetical protein